MGDNKSRAWFYAGLAIFLVLLVDQVLKFYIKLNFYWSEEINVLGLSWFRLHFIENEGMAFGIKFWGTTGKIILTLFRIVAVCFIGWYLRSIIFKRARIGLVISIALIFAGALGNIIDSVFYGMIFSDSLAPHRAVAELFPPEGGYAPILQGRVVDMLHFPLLSGYYPEWFPVIGGNAFTFFSPVFNIADTAISAGVFMIIIFHKRFFQELNDKPESEDEHEAVQSEMVDQNDEVGIGETMEDGE